MGIAFVILPTPYTAPMKKSPLIPAAILCFAALLAAICPASGQEKIPQPDLSFFTKLRMDYAKRADFNPLWKEDAQRKALIDAFKAATGADAQAAEAAYAKTADLAKAWLEKCPVDAEVHFIRGQALIAMHDITNYASERYYCYGLIQSVASSGDGQSEKTAFKVISDVEEYFLLGDFGAEPIGQTVQGACDVVRCKLPDGSEATYFFDKSIAIAAEAKLAEPKK